MCEEFKCIRMLPKCIDKLLNIVLTTITKSLVRREWVRLLSLRVRKKQLDSGGGILGFFHGEEDPKRKHRINKSMRITHAEESLSGEIRDAVGVVGDTPHVFDELDLRQTSG